MAIREIVLYPNEALLKKADPIEKVGPEHAKLAADMFETMEAYDGVGLAGPQIGVSQRILVLHEPEHDKAMCLINPEISDGQGQETAEEGCLSLPHIYAPVSRYGTIHVRALNELGKRVQFEASGLLARIVQHETDHLDGVVFVDRVDIMTREAKIQEWNEVRERLEAGPVAR